MSDKPFHILYLSSYGLLYGGGQQSLFQLVTNLDRTVFKPHVVVPSEGMLADMLREQGIDVHVIDLPKVLNPDCLRSAKAQYRLLRLCTLLGVDVIHTDGPRNTFYAALAARIKRIPLVWHVRVSDKDRYDRLLYRLSSKIILVADALRSRFDWSGQKKKLITVYNGIDLTEFRPGTSEVSLRQTYGIEETRLLISVVARVERLKGQKYVIEACGILKEKMVNFTLVMVGSVAEKDYLKECEERALEFGIRDHVIFAGYHDHIRNVLVETDIFVLPSLSEAFPRSVIEAMGVEKPVIVTDVGGCSEAVEGGVSGFVVPPKNPEMLADRIHELAIDKSLRVNMGKAARIRAETMFDISRNAEKTQQVYEGLLR
jgi:glycosyltransferase involved in cell wall biosynthesis